MVWSTNVVVIKCDDCRKIYRGEYGLRGKTLKRNGWLEWGDEYGVSHHRCPKCRGRSKHIPKGGK